MFWVFGFALYTQNAAAQLYETEIEGLNAEEWADKIIAEGEALFSAQYEPLDEDYALYSLMIRIVLGNPTPEEQMNLSQQYRKTANKSGQRRHILISQMFEELLGGSQNIDYYIENGDWFTKMIARWIEANYLDRNNAKFVDLIYFYEPIVEANSDDLAYPAAMVLLTDLKRARHGSSGDLPAYIRNYKENYYWMRRLYPEYNVTLVYSFDTLSAHYNMFGDPSALKIIDRIDQRSISPINAIIMTNRESRIYLHMGEYEKASKLLEDFLISKPFEEIKQLPVCTRYCPITYAYAALSAIASGNRELGQRHLNEIKTPEDINNPEFLFYYRAAKALVDMANPTEADISNWVDITKNGQSRRDYINFRQLVDPEKRFSPPIQTQQYWPGLPWYLGFATLLLGFSAWLYKSRRDRTLRLADLSKNHEKASRRNGIFLQHLNNIHSLNERSSEQAQTAILSLERHIEDVRTLESVDMVSRSISAWSEELSNLVFSAKYMATGIFETKDLVDFRDFMASAKTRWDRTARLEKSTLVLSAKSTPNTIRTNKILLNSVLDIFVHDALKSDTNGVVDVNFETSKDQSTLHVIIHSQGQMPEDYSKLLAAKLPASSENPLAEPNIDNQNQVYALKALIEIGGGFQQKPANKNQGYILKLSFPIETVPDDLAAANSNQSHEDHPRDESF